MSAGVATWVEEGGVCCCTEAVISSRFRAWAELWRYQEPSGEGRRFARTLGSWERRHPCRRDGLWRKRRKVLHRVGASRELSPVGVVDRGRQGLARPPTAAIDCASHLRPGAVSADSSDSRRRSHPSGSLRESVSLGSRPPPALPFSIRDFRVLRPDRTRMNDFMPNRAPTIFRWSRYSRCRVVAPRAPTDIRPDPTREVASGEWRVPGGEWRVGADPWERRHPCRRVSPTRSDQK